MSPSPSPRLHRQTVHPVCFPSKFHILIQINPAASLSFADDTFDKITTVESFYFWPAPQENLKEVRRVLKPGGTFVLVADTYNKEGLDPKTLENIYRFHLFTPTREEFQELFEKAGFEDIQIHIKEGTDWICVEGKK